MRKENLTTGFTFQARNEEWMEREQSPGPKPSRISLLDVTNFCHSLGRNISWRASSSPLCKRTRAMRDTGMNLLANQIAAQIHRPRDEYMEQDVADIPAASADHDDLHEEDKEDVDVKTPRNWLPGRDQVNHQQRQSAETGQPRLLFRAQNRGVSSRANHQDEEGQQRLGHWHKELNFLP
ncbi:hypothetical protein R1flu_004851 [Riccia fluitans]|uniref:Uncharacterized protein n=1 Tax=Riccia fluitans TaxID=41844 RepID=A0ABD1YUI2_9MARC